MEWSEPGIVLSTRRHGEADVILEAMTLGRGRHLGLVKGGRSRRLRPALQPGNTLQLTWRARLSEHLGNFRPEPVVERAGAIMADRGGTYLIQVLAAHLRMLPERDPHPALHEALKALLDLALAGGFAPRAMAEGVVRFEILFLEEMGVGLDLSACAATGLAEELVYVSPKSGRAVSRQAGAAYDNRLLRLPAFLAQEGESAAPGMGELAEGFRLTGLFLERHVFSPRDLPMPPMRTAFIRTVLGGA
ncbi:DNA repair protein RecO [Afifella pfennigii]|uniref:DNA repair protein RecO n=1 Tax=Afifella pfennigii TaxID=209897 RepID=UPI00047E3BF2|nr:DNA repair protein RecO [Afifella pfennigii]